MKKNVLIVENIHASKINGGIPVYIKNVIIANPNCDFTVIGTGLSDWEYSKFLSVNDTEIGHISYLIKTLLYIFKKKIYQDYDVIHFHRLDIAVIGTFFRLFGGVKIYTTLHGDHLNSLKSKKSKYIQYFYRVLANIGRRAIDKVIILSKDFDYMVMKDQNYKIIPVGIDETSYGKPDEYIRGDNFLYVGRIDKEKGVDFLISNFLESGIQNKLIIVGSGPMLDKLSERFKNSTKVEFLGYVAQDEIHTIYNKSQCLLLTSEFEASPTVVREALYFNCNVISLDVGDIKEQFSELDCVQVVSKKDFKKTIRSFKYVKDCISKIELKYISSNILYKNYYD